MFYLLVERPAQIKLPEDQPFAFGAVTLPAWAETVTRVAQTGVPNADYEAAAVVFNEKEFADLTIAIVLMNLYNRLAISFRVPPAAAKRLLTAQA